MKHSRIAPNFMLAGGGLAILFSSYFTGIELPASMFGVFLVVMGMAGKALNSHSDDKDKGIV